MNTHFKKGFEKSAGFKFKMPSMNLKHTVSLDDDVKDFLKNEIRQATDTMKPQVGPKSIFGAALISGLGLSAGNYLAKMFGKGALEAGKEVSKGIEEGKDLIRNDPSSYYS